MITINGSGFADGATVTFGGSSATNVIIQDQTRITCTPPAHADGLVSIVVTNPDGMTGTLAGVFIYTTLTVTPKVGPITGGTTLTLTISDGGANFPWFPAGHSFAVFVDNQLRALGVNLSDPDLIINPGTGGALPYTRISNSQISCTTLAQPCGPTDVIVIDLTKIAMSEPNVAFYLPLEYIYQLPLPIIDDVQPLSGPTRGGTHILITGGFSCVTCQGGGQVHVDIGGVPLTSLGCAPDAVSGITGVHAAGIVDVVVTNADGQTVTLPNVYTYVDAPTVTNINPNVGPDAGGTAVTITGTGFQSGATVMLSGLITPEPPGSPYTAIADMVTVVVVSATTITATTGAAVPGIFDVVVTNPDGQRGTLERAYHYEGWWITLPPEPELWIYTDEPIPGHHWRREALLTPPTDGWWMSTAAYGGAVLVVASSRPKDPRRWGQIAAFATGSTAMLGGSPGIAGVFHNRMVYAASDYTVGTTYPPIRIYDGSFDRELCRLPPTLANTVPIAVLSLLVANGTIYLSTFDSGSSSADWLGRVFALDLNTATLTPIGGAFPTGHLPYALAWHNGMLWCGTHRQATDVAGKIFRIRPDLAASTWIEEITLPVGVNIATLYSWRGTLYAGTTVPAGTFAQIRARGSDNTWTVVDTASGGTAKANNGHLAFCAFGNALYASYWNADTPAVATIRSTTDGTTWTTRYTGAAGTLRPFIVLTVDDAQLFAIGGGAHLTAAILRTPDGMTWTNLTIELPDTDKTALPAAATLVF